MRQWFCANCGRAKWVETVPSFSDICVGCGEMHRWRCDGEPVVPYELSLMDRQFLKSLKIDPEAAPVIDEDDA